MFLGRLSGLPLGSGINLNRLWLPMNKLIWESTLKTDIHWPGQYNIKSRSPEDCLPTAHILKTFMSKT